jgi:hypothetical protein
VDDRYIVLVVDDGDVSVVDIDDDDDDKEGDDDDDDDDELVIKSITCKCFNSVYLLSIALDSEYIGVSP